MTAWPSERAAIENMIAHFGSGLFACVMDSYDYSKVMTSTCQPCSDTCWRSLLYSSTCTGLHV